MPIFRILFLLFLSLPLLELYILFQIGSVTGAIPAILLCIFTAALGAFLLRLQGLQTLARVQSKLQQGELPATDMLGGLILLICGVLLLTPGFLTDIIGFLCLIPAFRDYLANGILRQQLQTRGYRTNENTVIVEGEYWEDNGHRQIKQ